MKWLLSILFFGFLSVSVHSQVKKFNKQDSIKLSYCKCDSLYAAWKSKIDPKAEAPEYDGNGWNRILNFQGEIGQCGYFNKFYFLYGLRYKYDENGVLKEIQKYYNGKMVGKCELKKK
jgi:hypothetical protein